MTGPTDKLWMDSVSQGIAYMVHCDVVILDENVRLETFAFDRERAFERMDKVLHRLGFHGERVRVY